MTVDAPHLLIVDGLLLLDVGPEEFRSMHDVALLAWGLPDTTNIALYHPHLFCLPLPSPVTHATLKARADALIAISHVSRIEKSRRDVLAKEEAAERLRAARALEVRDAQFRQMHERLEMALLAGNVGSFVWELASDLVYGDPNLARIFGLPSNDANGVPAPIFFAAIHSEDQERNTAEREALLKNSDDHFISDFRVGTGAKTCWLSLRGRLHRNVNGEVDRVLGVVTDLTERVAAERALRQSEAQLRQLANTIPNLVWMADSEGWIHWYNDRWYTYTGTTPAEMEGWGWQSVHDPDVLPAVLEKWQASIATGQPFEMTFPLRGADGIFRPFLTLVAPLRDSEGHVVQWFGTNTDVSPLKQAEEQLREADRRKDEFLAMLAHELRNPLAPIRTAAELLRRLDSTDRRISNA
ncbi:MAG: PAS domain S-box protein, partial [Candidatus Obscuribacterales bacterium]|nr:PAS domain S-box protein [Steroidobacteraceae bacterium]